MKLQESAPLKIEPELFLPTTNPPSLPGSAGRYRWKTNIVTEIFWIGEPATGSRSAWDPEAPPGPSSRYGDNNDFVMGASRNKERIVGRTRRHSGQ